jgi:hypothetical protein
LPRTSKVLVYQQIIADLKDAQGLLNANYVDAGLINTTAERVRPTRAAAAALLARAYLYTADYKNAETQSSAVISNAALYQLDTLNSVFLKNSNEAIWQLQPVLAVWNTQDAQFLVFPASGPNNDHPIYLNPVLVGSFETGDQRKTKWVGMTSDTLAGVVTKYYYPYKYQSATPGAPVTEYTMILRLAEQYLIRAEARASQGDLSGGASDLNIIRNRAGLPNTTANSQASLLSDIIHERQVELFSEWGHRWFDLKRTGTVDAVMSIACPLKGGAWNTNWQLYPVPLDELHVNPNLTQNSGY